MRFGLFGTYEGEEAVLSWDDGSVRGFPYGLVGDAQEALVDAERAGYVSATATGPFYPHGTPLAALVTLMQLFDVAEVEGIEVPVFGDELGWLDEHGAEHRFDSSQSPGRPY